MAVQIQIPAARDAALDLARRLQEAGHTAYWAGGCVRDMLLGREPKDFDIATDARPERLLQLFPDSVQVGASFAVLRVPSCGHVIEVATFRRDLDYEDGRRPTGVEFADAVTDAHRRDFTINALFYDPVADRLFDYVRGRADLDAGIVRCIGDPDERFGQDYLRLLRAVRFAAVLGFRIESGTRLSLKRHAGMISNIALERVRDEMSRTLTEAPKPGDSIAMMEDLGLLAAVLPEVAELRKQEQPPQFHPEGDVLQHTIIMLNLLPHADPRLAWAALLHDVGKPGAAFRAEDRLRFHGHAESGAATAGLVMDRLRFPGSFADDVVQMVGNHMRFMDVRNMRRSTLRRLAGAPLFDLELELHRADCLASHGNLANYSFLLEFRNAMKAEPALPQPFLGGRDLLAMGMREGPEIGRILREAYDLQLEGSLPDRRAAAEWARNRIGERPLVSETVSPPFPTAN